MTTLAQEHDCLLLDLDGTVFRGHEPTAGAVDTLAAVTSRKLYVTNNASRASEEVAGHLRAMGFAAEPDDVVTSAQSAARLLADRLPAGAKVLVVGTDSLAAEITTVGLKPVRQWSDDPGRRRAGAFAARPRGPISRRRHWPSGAGRCGSRPTSTGRCRPNAACFPVTARWSPPCRPRPIASPVSRASPHPGCSQMPCRAATFRSPAGGR